VKKNGSKEKSKKILLLLQIKKTLTGAENQLQTIF
jgi:hypothetical protein